MHLQSKDPDQFTLAYSWNKLETWKIFKELENYWKSEDEWKQDYKAEISSWHFSVSH